MSHPLDKDAEIAKLQKQLHDASQVSPTEREGIECHIRTMLSEKEQEELGLTGRQLHMQVLRILSGYRDATDQVVMLTVERDAATDAERARWQNVHADFG